MFLNRLGLVLIPLAFAFPFSFLGLPVVDLRQDSVGSTSNVLELSELSCNFKDGRVSLLMSESRPFKRAWLVCFDKSKTGGWLYAPPFVLLLSRGAAHSAVTQYRSEDLPDHSYYTIDLKPSKPNLEGSLTLHSMEPVAETRHYEIEGTRIDEGLTDLEKQFVGRYSNARYIEEAGELVGSELLMFSTDQHLSGLIVFYEGFWGEPIFVPMPLSNVQAERSGEVRFTIKLEENEAHYKAILSKGSLVLARTDVPSVPEASVVRLKKEHYFLSHHN